MRQELLRLDTSENLDTGPRTFAADEQSLAPLWDHQRTEVEEHWNDPARALLWDPRIGKTRTIVRQMCRLCERSGLRRLLVVGPQRALQDTWSAELNNPDIFPWRVVDLSHGEIKDRIAKIREDRAARQNHPGAPPTVLLVNYDVLHKLANALCTWGAQFVCLDESHLCKTASAARTRSAQRVCAVASHARALTGTPTPSTYIDFYAQYKAIDPTIFGTNKLEFTDRYVIFHPTYKTMVLGYKNLDELREKVFSIASRVRASDCFDMPLEHDVVRRIVLPDHAQALYEELAHNELINSELEDGPLKVDGTHKLTRLLHFRKLTSGFLANDADKTPRVVHRAKFDAIVDELREPLDAGRKAVVFYAFDFEGLQIVHAINTAYGGLVARHLHGGTPDAQSLVANFDPSQTPNSLDCQVLVVQEQVGGLGISFARADYVIFASHSFAYDVHDQCRKRIWKPAPAKLFYTYLVVPGSIDVFARRVVRNKESAARRILDVGFANAIHGTE